MGDNKDWEKLANLCKLVPTPHNTQPFRIRPTKADPKVAELVCLIDRLLPKEDHGNLYCMAAFGIFEVALKRAGAHFGIVVQVEPKADIDPETVHEHSREIVLGTARIIDSCEPQPYEELLKARRTSRIPYDQREVPNNQIDELKAITESAGHRFITHSEPDIVRASLRLNVDAIIDNLQIKAEREEIHQWHRLGSTPEHGDGLWQIPLNQPAWELRAAFAVPWLFLLPGFRALARYRQLKTQKGTRHIGLLCGPFKEWQELLSAGRMLLKFWLSMAKHGIYMQPFGSTLTNPIYAQRVAEMFGVQDPWLILRFGYSPEPPRPPRLESILIDE